MQKILFIGYLGRTLKSDMANKGRSLPSCLLQRPNGGRTETVHCRSTQNGSL